MVYSGAKAKAVWASTSQAVQISQESVKVETVLGMHIGVLHQSK